MKHERWAQPDYNDEAHESSMRWLDLYWKQFSRFDAASLMERMVAGQAVAAWWVEQQAVLV
ncbi:MAG TPA: hypothetical protein VFI24_20825 [Pyrinomonadaceae bacterium]|nr:hypothetical protein [Pyrinomonadaceae bacterium]